MGNDDKTKFVRIDRFTVELVEESKELTGVGVGRFFEKAAMEKLEKEKVVTLPKKKKK
jgi:hypothetical protein